MKILIFEYSTVIFNDNLIIEGYNMLKSILTDLDKLNEFEVHYLINENQKIENLKNCRSIHLNQNLMNWLEENSSFYDYCLFIAPEDNYIQYNITKILEKNQVTVLCSDSVASYICSSKNKTYETVPSEIKKIPSIKRETNSCNYDEIKNIFKENEIIVKPDNRTSSNFIYRVNNEKDFNEVIKKYKENKLESVLIQEFIDGESVSVSIICNEDYVNCLSLNSQIIENKKDHFKYCGCQSPLNHPLKNEIYDMSKKIIRSIKGLKGFVGIDFIIKNDEIYFVEINSRITTPFIVLNEITNVNLTKYLIDVTLGKKDSDIKLTKKGTFMTR